MKLLHAIMDMSINGGAQRLLRDLLVCALNDPDIQADLCVLAEDNQTNSYVPELESLGINVYQIKKLDFLRFRNIAKKYDAVHAHLFPALYWAAMSPVSKRVYTEHNTYNNRRKYPKLSRLEGWAYSKYDTVGAITPEVKTALLEWLPQDKAPKIDIVYNGVDIKAFKGLSAVENYSLPDGTIHVGMVGSLTPKKDQETLIAALVNLPEYYHVSLVGDGSERPKLEALAEELGVSSRVHFKGIISDVPNFLASLDIYVQSSKWEGFGLAAIEAMAADLAVLCSDVPGLNNLAESKEILFPQGDAEALAVKLEQFGDVEYWADMLTISRKTAQQYSVENTYLEYKALYLA